MPLLLLTALFLLWPPQARSEIAPFPPAAAPLTSSVYDAAEKFLWAATPQQLFMRAASAEPQAPWRPLNAFPAGEHIHRLQPAAGRSVFILTERSIFRQSPAGPLEKIFSRTADESRVLSLAAPAQSGLWLAGTTAGLFVSRDEGLSWTSTPRFSGKVISFVFHSGPCLVADETYLYRGETFDTLQPVWRFPSDSSGSGESESDEENSPAVFIPELVKQENHLWLTTREGVIVSRDLGLTWARLPSAGLQNQTPHRLAAAPRSGLLVAASPYGLFVYSTHNSRWFRLSQALHGNPVSLAVLDGEPETILAVTAREFISLPLIPEQLFQPEIFPAPETAEAFRKKIDAEPSALAVQKAVLRAFGLDGAKIKRWHTESRLRALVPSVSFDKDFSRANSIDLDRGGTSDPDVYIHGPDDIDEGWSFDVSWDLADFIWSSAQTSIDVREKLLIDQRRDFLSEAMRIYFERRRLQAELFFGDYENEGGAFSFQFEKRLRCEELTSMLDALTAGWFSAQLIAA